MWGVVGMVVGGVREWWCSVRCCWNGGGVSEWWCSVECCGNGGGVWGVV